MVSALFEEAGRQMHSQQQRNRVAFFDPTLVWALLIVMGIGLVMVFSASIAQADASKDFGHNSHFYLIRQGIFMLLGLCVGMAVIKVPINWWQKSAPVLFVFGLLLLIVVVIPGLGHSINGATRWISLGGFNFQPSEVMKILVPLYVANFAVRKSSEMNNFKKVFLPMAVTMLIVGMILIQQSDFGSFAVMSATAVSILWLAGINLPMFAITLAILVAGLTGFVVSEPYRIQRIDTFLNGPWSDPFGAGYQISHAFMAYGRGEWFGVGLGGSIEKLLYLPEPHTDFILAVTAEELGFVGVFTVIALLTYIVVRGFQIAKVAAQYERNFSALLAQGICVWLSLQSIINIGGSMGFLPSKGITLPFMSYGGSSLLVSCLAIAIVMRVDYESRRIQRGLPL